MTTIDAIIDHPASTPKDLASARKLALAAARDKYKDEQWGAVCKVHGDDLMYVVERDGVHRLTKSPECRTTSDRIV